MQLLRLIPIAAIASNCMLLSGKCIYEIRSLQASGSVIENDTVAAAEVTDYEQRDSDPYKELFWRVTGPTLKGHVTSLTLRDTADPTRALLTLDLAPPDRPEISANTVSTKTGANLGGVFEIIGTNRGFLRLDTDLPARPTITVPLTMTSKQNWTRPNCS